VQPFKQIHALLTNKALPSARNNAAAKFPLHIVYHAKSSGRPVLQAAFNDSGVFMRSILTAMAAVVLTLGSAAAQASDLNVGVSVGGQISPGVYGRVDIGNTPPPVVYQQPVIIQRQARQVRPVYMHVPPGHAKNWGKHCHKYNACAQPVYFVRSGEYEGRGNGHGGKHGGRHGHDDHHGHDRKERKHGHHHD
jgi:hypothetical protein